MERKVKRVDLNEICRDFGIQHYTYSQYWKKPPAVTAETDGMAFYRGNVPTILYDNSKSAERIRFVVAHELGHILMDHLKRPGMKPMEVQADLFATILLAADLLSEYGLEDLESDVEETMV